MSSISMEDVCICSRISDMFYLIHILLRASYTLQDVIGLKLFNRPSVIFGLNPCTH